MTRPVQTEASDSLFKSGSAVYTLCMPYIIGARLQIERYLEVQRLLDHETVTARYKCIHELSNLYEDLDMIRRYTQGLGIDLWDDKLFIADIRNAIRHDTRREQNSKNNETRVANRSGRLQVNTGLKFGLIFLADGIKVGQQKITLKEISHYVDCAEKLLGARSFGVRETYKDSQEHKK